MDKMILVLLILMVIEQALGLAYNFSTRARNEAIAADNERRIKEENQQLKKQLQGALDAMYRGLDPTGFLITSEGIKALQNGWREKLLAEDSK